MFTTSRGGVKMKERGLANVVKDVWISFCAALPARLGAGESQAHADHRRQVPKATARSGRPTRVSASTHHREGPRLLPRGRSQLLGDEAGDGRNRGVVEGHSGGQRDARVLGPSRKCSKHHWVAFDSTIEGLKCVEGHFEQLPAGPTTSASMAWPRSTMARLSTPASISGFSGSISYPAARDLQSFPFSGQFEPFVPDPT